jgi:hypothetical protein
VSARLIGLLALSPLLLFPGGGGAGNTSATAPPPLHGALLEGTGSDGALHDLHLAYGDMAVEGRVLAGRIRMFKDDLELALAPLAGRDGFRLQGTPEEDALVLRYISRHLAVTVGGSPLEPSLVASGEDELDREPVWWVLIQFQAPEPLERFTVRNTILFDVFEDQRNVFKFVRFPDQEQRTFYFAPGEEEHEVRFP